METTDEAAADPQPGVTIGTDGTRAGAGHTLRMATPTEQHEQRDLATELRELEAHEEAIEHRTRSLEIAGPLALVFSIVAIAAAIGALVISLSSDSGMSGSGGMAGAGAAGTGSGAGQAMGTSSSPSGMMMGAGGHGQFTAAEKSAAARGTVYAQLGEFWVAPAVASVRAGKVTFKAKNVGRMTHELMVERMPMKFTAPNEPNEKAAQGMINDMKPGASGSMTLKLKPGMYTLFCNLPGHYAAGQHLTFRVTKS